jgi:Cu+-exporting ATPase
MLMKPPTMSPPITMGLFDKLRGKDATTTTATLVEDPVCHMKIDPAKAAGKSTHGPQTYHFCSPGCKGKFDRDPHKYLGAHHH